MKTVYHLRCGGIEQRTLTRETEHTVWLKTSYGEERFQRDKTSLYPTFETAKAALVAIHERLQGSAQSTLTAATHNLTKAKALTVPRPDPADFVPPGKLAL